jgi:hypothetical protein
VYQPLTWPPRDRREDDRPDWILAETERQGSPYYQRVHAIASQLAETIAHRPVPGAECRLASYAGISDVL